jgi:hypothetical protein
MRRIAIILAAAAACALASAGNSCRSRHTAEPAGRDLPHQLPGHNPVPGHITHASRLSQGVTVIAVTGHFVMRCWWRRRQADHRRRCRVSRAGSMVSEPKIVAISLRKRNLPGWWRVLGGAGDSEERNSEHGQGGPPVPGAQRRT